MAKRKNSYPWQASYPEGVEWDEKIVPKKLDILLDEAVDKYPDNICTNFFGKKTTYKEIADEVAKAAKGLQDIGIVKGDKVGIFLPNTPYSIISYYAILKIGAVVVNLSPLATVAELSYQVEVSRLKLIISVDLNILYEKVSNLIQTTPLDKAVIASFEDALPFPKNILFRWFKSDDIASVPYGRVKIDWNKLLDNNGEYVAVDVNHEEDLAVMQFTGGTTGTPKAAQLTHANLYSNTIQCGMWFVGLEEGEEKMAGVIPLFHVFAMTVVMNLGIHKACEIILYPKPDILQLLKDVQKQAITLLPGVPTLFNGIRAHPLVRKYDLSSLKSCISGGAPLLAEMRKEFEDITDARLVEGYGLTESSPVVSANPLDGSGKDGSIGLPFPSTIVEIRSTDGNNKLLEQGEIGEICVEGPQVMKGYLNNEKENKSTLKSGRLHTGDLGYIDKDGYIFVVDRLKELIITSGYNVYPREVEEVLAKHNKVSEVAVIGVEDKSCGQFVKAFVVLRVGEEATESDLKDFCGRKLSKYKIPRTFEIVNELPKTMIGKIDKKKLR